MNRPCNKCNKIFTPTGRSCRICNECNTKTIILRGAHMQASTSIKRISLIINKIIAKGASNKA